MKITIDCRMWSESGIGRYLRNLISELQKLDKKNEYFLLLLKKDYENEELIMDSRFRGNDKEGNFHKVLADFRWYTVREQIELPGLLNRLKSDLVHFPHFNVPIFYRGKFVVTIHDLIHQHFQMRRVTTLDPLTYKLKHFGYKKVFGVTVRNAVSIITPSEFVKKQLMDEWDVESRKITVTPEAVDTKLYTTVHSLVQDKVNEMLDKFNIKKPYVFYVGNAHPHKNVEGLIKAFLKLKSRHSEFNTKYQASLISGSVNKIPKQVRNDNRGLQLVLSGANNYFWKKVKEKYNLDSRLRGNDNVVEDIIFTGFVTDEEMVALYKGAQCFIMPSFEEGFGIPILEAMAAGCPVVSSNAGALKEVGGDAAVYFNPHDQGDMVDKIDGVFKDGDLRKELMVKGKKRVKKFSWKKMAEKTLEVYNETI